jgi:hypothetical protein
MRPLKPIKQIVREHRELPAKSTHERAKTLEIRDPYYNRPLKPLVIESAAEMIAKLETMGPPPEYARFGPHSFMSGSVVLISNDGWKGHALDVSLRLAHHFAYQKRRRTLYLNSIVRQDALGRKFKHLMGKSHKPNGLLQLATIQEGKGGEGLASLVESIIEEQIDVLILNSWEWAALTGTERGRLMSALHHLHMSLGICIVVFKLGMLSLITDIHIDLREENELLPTLYNDDLTIPSEEEKPIYMTKPKENNDEKKTTQAIVINDLEEVMGTGAHVTANQEREVMT